MTSLIRNMEQLPKLVRQRLQATAKAGVHPDPDLLACFAERSLSESERVAVLEHLANCPDCRQIVSFSVPPLERQPAPVAAAWPSPAGGWHRLGLRWAAVAACVAVAGGAVMLGRHALATKENLIALEPTQPMPKDHSKPTQASQRADQIVARAEPPQSAGVSARVAASPEEARQLVKLQKQSAKTGGGVGFGVGMPQSHLRESGAAPAMVAQAAPAQADQQRSTTGRQEDGLQASPAQIPAASEAVQVESAAPGVSSQQLQVYPTESKDFAPPAPPSEPASGSSGRSLKGIVGGSVISRNEAVQDKTAGDTIMPRWTLSSDGTLLLRSFDNGQTWQSIPVAGRVVFRALSALGPEVWIAGSAGALYHSSDRGQHWQKVEPAADGRILVADIIALEFIDSQHGKLITANHEVWITADAGHSWQLK
jgi:hypothetical protein